ncbi:MAG: lysine--tRNA ligase [Pyrinomonadaceae bacterium]
MNIPEFNEIIEPNDQTEARREHLEKLREIVGNVYPNKFERSNITGAEDTITRVVAFAAPIKDKHIPHLAENERPTDEQREAANAELNQLRVRIAGRMAVPPRVMGKAAFVHLSDGVSRLQIYCRKEDFTVLKNTNSPDSRLSTLDSWTVFGLLDHGDFIGVEGYLFVTKTGELSVHVETIQFLSKAMLPMPDKMHGISDPELQRRYRYADLIASSLQVEHEGLTTREVFERRAKLISGMRRFLDDAGFIEVETPILTPKATGAAAEPFETYHKALDIKLYARIAPELYLKRLMVGGFEKVYELNRNFRNEGLSHKHSPEFTMLEFYCAYMDVNGMMDFAEAMIKESVQKATGGNLQVKYGENEVDFSKFERLTMKQAIEKYSGFPVDEIFFDDLNNLRRIHAVVLLTELRSMKNGIVAGFTSVISDQELLQMSYEKQKEYIRENRNSLWKITEIFSNFEPDKNIAEQKGITETEFRYIVKNLISDESDERKKARIIEKSFENYAENILGLVIDKTDIKETVKTIVQPTFIIDYPKVISPLSKASPENPNVAERFELFINGMECANGFSELNDPQEQYERFREQMNERETGDAEAMVLDEDYIRALAYGMPPAAGIGIGIDRLVMLLTNKHSIRDVILFPHMRPERKDEEKGRKGEEES